MCSGTACRCEGRWILSPETYEVFDQAGINLKAMKSPITLELWATEAKDKRSIRGDLEIGNTLGFIVAAKKSAGFCDHDVELLAGAVSPRRMTLTNVAKNEKELATRILNKISYWDCNEKKGTLTIGSPEAKVTFLKTTPEHSPTALLVVE